MAIATLFYIMKRNLLAALFMSIAACSYAQLPDSLQGIKLDEIIVLVKTGQKRASFARPLAVIDDYLQSTGKVEMVKRGAYASELLLNSMTTERTVVTIDGMRIFGACTDKMDPVTSYVEISNLQEAKITSGQEGGAHGATIGGAVDLVLTRHDFKEKGWKGNVNMGYETNNAHKILGAGLKYGDSSFFAKVDFMMRNAGNYTDGRKNEVSFSQFTKYNAGVAAGYKISSRHSIDGNVIYDRAVNVGYPSLPMDVSLAEALITSVQHQYRAKKGKKLAEWNTKLYYNTIEHIMDDTKRPAVPIHMDMPGWSKTAGMYSNQLYLLRKHFLQVNLNAYYNYSVAEMTMYPPSSEEALMFMYTWPKVHTWYSGVFIQDRWNITEHGSLKLTGSIGVHQNSMRDRFGIESLEIFYPQLDTVRTRVLKSVAGSYNYQKAGFEWSVGAGYGERAPTVSEAYGFYLFNSFDRYDYIGNPQLKTENSVDVSVSVGYGHKKWRWKAGANYFLISNYIVGKIHTDYIPMTIGASGIKVYEAIPSVSIMNADITAEYEIISNLKASGQLVYAFGQDHEGNNLPLISPFRYRADLHYEYRRISGELTLQGNTEQTKFNPFYGESRTAAWAIMGIRIGYTHPAGKTELKYNAGVENLTNTYYTTYSDWNKFPRMGRNFFLNVAWKF